MVQEAIPEDAIPTGILPRAVGREELVSSVLEPRLVDMFVVARQTNYVALAGPWCRFVCNLWDARQCLGFNGANNEKQYNERSQLG